jgi:hypothetical protein
MPRIIVIRHYGCAFQSNANAVLLFSGALNHVVLLK